MFLLEEKQRLNQLFFNIKDQTIDDILSELEIEAIENSSSPLEKIRYSYENYLYNQFKE